MNDNPTGGARRAIEQNLAASLLMAAGEPADGVAEALGEYQPADTAEERARTSARRVLAATGLASAEPDDDPESAYAGLLEWFTINDAELQEMELEEPTVPADEIADEEWASLSADEQAQGFADSVLGQVDGIDPNDPDYAEMHEALSSWFTGTKDRPDPQTDLG